MKIRSQLSRYTKVIVAFSLFSTQFISVQDKIVEYKEMLGEKDHIVIAGGPHGFGDPLSLLRIGVDLVCIGEGELVIRNIITNYINEKSFETLRGIALLNADSKMIRTPSSPMIKLDNFPPFSVKHRLIRPIEITRGCAWKCRFCQIRSRGMPVRHRSVNEILKYVIHTINHFSKRRPDIRFISPNALSYGSKDGKSVNLEKVETLLKSIKAVIGKEGKIYFGSFPSEIRPETINHDSIRVLRKYSNVNKIIIGGQSGSNKLLKFSDRGHDAKETERAVKLLISAGFDVDVDIIFGLPEENNEDVQLTIKHMETLTELGASIHSHTFLPLVGTPFASKPAGKINSIYLPIIDQLQSTRKLSGFHVRQQVQAKLMENQKKKTKQNNRYSED